MENRLKRKRKDETKPSGKKGKSTVCFNVGGRIYEVSRSLLDQYPDTMLARLASDTWSSRIDSDDTRDRDSDGDSDSGSHKDAAPVDDDGGNKKALFRSLLNQHPNTMLARLASVMWSKVQSGGGKDAAPIDDDGVSKKALFIERNGDRFQYCLDYMRDGGTAVIPQTVSKDALLQDLAYYGFREVDPSAISVEGSLAMATTGHRHIDSLIIERNRGYVKLISEILLHFDEYSSLEIDIEDSRDLYSTAKELFEGDKNEFIAYLKTVGFKLNKIECVQTNKGCGYYGYTAVVIRLELL